MSISLAQKETFIIVLMFQLIIPAHGLNLGLIAGDNKRLSSPLIIKKVAKLSPVFINIITGPKIDKSLSPLLKLPSKPPPLRLTEPKLSKSKRSPLIPIPLLPPIIPKLPLLPIIPLLPPLLPPILPPILPPLPLIPRLPITPPLRIVSHSPAIPLLSIEPALSIPILKDPLKPLRIPILGKSPLAKVLDPKVRPVNVKGDILKKLLDLKREGSLTTSEFIRFKKLLIK